MERININLLPEEFSHKQREQAHIRKLQAVSGVIILIMIFLASSTLALRIIQLKSFQTVEAKAKAAEDKVTDFKDKEANLTVLKNRINIIKQVKAFPSRTSSSFDEILKLVPNDVLISSSSVDRNGTILLSIILPSSQTLATFLGNVLSDEVNMFKKVEIESLSTGKDGVYRANLKILQK